MSKKWYSMFVVTDEPERPRASTAAPSEPPPVRAADLVAEVPPPAAPSPDDVSPAAADLGVVYASAQIVPPAHGYTVLKVGEMLRSEHLRDLPADVRRKSVLVALDAAGVKVDDVVQDAVRRDRALDTYERVLQQHVDQLAATTAAETKALEEEVAQRVAELRARIEENGRRLAAEQAELEAWRVRKQQEEALIAETVAHFVTDTPITTGRPAGTPQGDVDGR